MKEYIKIEVSQWNGNCWEDLPDEVMEKTLWKGDYVKRDTMKDGNTRLTSYREKLEYKSLSIPSKNILSKMLFTRSKGNDGSK